MRYRNPLRLTLVATLFALGLILSACTTSPTKTEATAESDSDRALESLVIVHTNDFHGHIAARDDSAGAARIAAFFSEMRSAHENVLVLDAGDAISGTPVSTLFSGLPIFEVMNEMGYDLGLLGNHEFDHGWRQIEKFRDSSDHPLLTANARGPDGELLGDMPYAIVKRGNLSIGVIGVVTEAAPKMITPLGNEGVNFTAVEKTLRDLVPKLRPQVDVLIVLSHTGHDAEKALAAAIPGIDVIVGGHSHSRVTEPVSIGDTLVAQAHEYGKAVGVIKLAVAPAGTAPLPRIKLTEGYLVDAAALGERNLDNPQVAAIVAGWEQKVSSQVDIDIAHSSRLIPPVQLRSWMEQVIREYTGADLAYYNRGGVRDAIRPGPVTVRTLWNIEPFGNSVVTLKVTGAQVRSILANNGDDAGIELEDGRTYLFATNNFVGAHVRRTLGYSVDLQDSGVLVRDILIEAIKTDGLPGQ